MIELSLDHLLGRKSKICYRLSFYRLFVGTPALKLTRAGLLLSLCSIYRPLNCYPLLPVALIFTQELDEYETTAKT